MYTMMEILVLKVRRSTGQIIVIFRAHKVPSSENWFQFLLEAPAILTRKSVLPCQVFFGPTVWANNVPVYFMSLDLLHA